MNLKLILERIFFPEECPVCKRILKINEDICLCCGSQEIKMSAFCCEYCAREKEDCECNNEHTCSLPHITGAYRYDGLIRAKLLAFKFSKRKEFHKFFSEGVSERVALAFPDVDFDSVTFVPSSKESLKSRGYNAAELIAKGTAEKFFLPCEDTLTKIKETRLQHTLDAEERMTNLIGSVRLKKGADVKGKTLLLCDDIKTTGATLKECTDALLKAGAKDVYCAVVAVTVNTVNFSALDKEDKSI